MNIPAVHSEFVDIIYSLPFESVLLGDMYRSDALKEVQKRPRRRDLKLRSPGIRTRSDVCK